MKNPKGQNKKDKYADKELLEQASNQLASIVIAWIELRFNRNKDKNVYDKRR